MQQNKAKAVLLVTMQDQIAVVISNNNTAGTVHQIMRIYFLFCFL